MKVIEARNVHQALPLGVRLLLEHGVIRGSRNGGVRVAPWPVTTVYAQPTERLTFWPQRDVNIAFLVYEALWMLAGRNDLAPLVRYVKDFGQFSDDGETLYGAYGYRWRKALDEDQLAIIAERLATDPDDRRSVLQMWQGEYDLGRVSKDLPCNVIATLQRAPISGALDLTVFCRSNDVVWGAYFANSFHFSVLQEYLARWIDCPVGIYRQVSVNYHAYHTTLETVKEIPAAAFTAGYADPQPIDDPYVRGDVVTLPLLERLHAEPTAAFIARLDAKVADVLMHADTGFTLPRTSTDADAWFEAAYAVLRAHACWRLTDLELPLRYGNALAALAPADPRCDLVVAMRRWLDRRHAAWLVKGSHASHEQARIL